MACLPDLLCGISYPVPRWMIRLPMERFLLEVVLLVAFTQPDVLWHVCHGVHQSVNADEDAGTADVSPIVGVRPRLVGLSWLDLFVASDADHDFSAFAWVIKDSPTPMRNSPRASSLIPSQLHSTGRPNRSPGFWITPTAAMGAAPSSIMRFGHRSQSRSRTA